MPSYKNVDIPNRLPKSLLSRAVDYMESISPNIPGYYPPYMKLEFYLVDDTLKPTFDDPESYHFTYLGQGMWSFDKEVHEPDLDQWVIYPVADNVDTKTIKSILKNQVLIKDVFINSPDEPSQQHIYSSGVNFLDDDESEN